MAHSRFSIPLFAVGLLAIAACMMYLVATKNIFHLSSGSIDNTSVIESNASEAHSPPSYSDLQDDSSIARDALAASETWNKKVGVQSARIIADNKNILESDKKGGSEDNTTALGVRVQTPNSAIREPARDDISQPALLEGDQLLGALWARYTRLVPALYSAPLTAETQNKLNRIAMLSSELDAQYRVNKPTWMIRIEELRPELIEIAVEGEREAVRALSFQYVRPPLNKTVEALAWAMVANAIAPNDYYLYVCGAEFSRCTENIFELASKQANGYVAECNFLPKKDF